MSMSMTRRARVPAVIVENPRITWSGGAIPAADDGTDRTPGRFGPAAGSIGVALGGVGLVSGRRRS